jgi:hypothetical protein
MAVDASKSTRFAKISPRSCVAISASILSTPSASLLVGFDDEMPRRRTDPTLADRRHLVAGATRRSSSVSAIGGIA